MKIKKILVPSLVLAGAVAAAMAVQLKSVKEQNTEKRALAFGFTEAFAADGDLPSDECFTTFKDVVAGSPERGSFTHKALDLAHKQIYRLNKVEPADVEMIFCRLEKVLGVEPDLTALPQTFSKTDPLGNTVKVELTAPTEAFATEAGYEAKAEVSSNDEVFLTVWWAGSQTASKGYLIKGKNPMAPDGMTRIGYVQWDRTAEDQSIKVFTTQFKDSYLGAIGGAAGSKSGGDGAHYGRLEYNTTTKAISAQSTEIRKGRVNSGCTDTSGVFACYRVAFYGTLEASVSVFRPALGCLESVTANVTDGTSLDGVTDVTDSPDTADAAAGSASGMTTVFDYSCNSVNNASATGEPFAGGEVDFTAEPSSIFP